MERIEELTGMNLDQANMRLALHLSLKLWQLRPEADRRRGTSSPLQKLYEITAHHSAKLTVTRCPPASSILFQACASGAVQWK